MHRLFGKSKPKEPTPTLDDAAGSIEKRGGDMDERIKKLDEELLRYKQQMAKMRPGPAKNQVQQRALRVLKQKKLYEKQRDSLYNQSFNIDQTRFAQQNVKDTVLTVNAMKAAHADLKVGMKAIKIDDIEDLHDDMSDLLEDADEINEIMGRAYGVPEELDESDLLDELNSLEDEIQEEESEELPSYLVNAATATKTAASTVSSKAEEETESESKVSASSSSSSSSSHSSKQAIEVDEFGLPVAPLGRNIKI